MIQRSSFFKALEKLRHNENKHKVLILQNTQNDRREGREEEGRTC